MPTLLDSKAESRRLVLPAQANAIRTAHGGNVLKWMEQTGSMSAMHFCSGEVITAGFDRSRFHNPIPEGDIALIDAYVYEVGTSSMTIRVRCFHENHKTGERSLTSDAKMVSVAVDEDGQSVDVPDLSVETEAGKRLQDEALNAEN
ncbi:acyl-CoA thioesterase [Halobacteriales archaeon QS_4_66_20]|nr:MAG: acyl-CoA thioesterase [Halobacteriales archaeon QS_4_66_20]